MAHAARPLTMSTEPQRTSDNEDTGRFAIDANERGTMLPPAEDGPKDVLSLEELGGSIIETKPRTAPPPPPARAAVPVSGVFPSDSKADPDAAFAERIISLSPIYTPAESAQAERAVLEIEDLSLRPDNPYLASSLVPPTEPKGYRSTLIAVAAMALVAGAGAGWYFARGPQAGPTAPAQKTAQAAALSKPAPVVASAPVAAETKLPVETAVPAEAVPAPAEVVKPAPSAPVAQHLVTPTQRPVVAKPAVVAPEAPVAHAPTAAPAQVTETAAPAAAPTAEASHPVAAEQPAATGPVTAEALPALPTREQVAAGFDAVRAQLEQCAAGQHGVASVAATVVGSGRVSYAVVQGKFAGTPEGSCMALAVRKAQFPRFSQPNLKVVYPFPL